MTHLVKHRYAADGGYQRGEETRSRIIAVAVELFGERGFEGVSTRDIAAQAGVNAPALPYYFDSKEGLYLACLEQVIANFWAFMGDIVEQAESTLVDHASDIAIIETFCSVQMRLAELACDDPSRRWRRLLERQQADVGPSFALQTYSEGITQRLFAVMVAVVARLLRTSTQNPETQVRTLILGGQLTVLQSMQRTTLTVLKRDYIGAKELALFKSVVREHTTVVLRSITATRAGSQH